MKKFILGLILCMVCIGTFARVEWYKSYEYAQKVYNYDYQCWSDWSRWEKSSINIKIDFDNDVITIFSPVKQIYAVYDYGEAYYDDKGGTQVPFYAVDQDGDKCNIRLRVGPNKELQLYVEFADAMWVYGVKRIY